MSTQSSYNDFGTIDILAGGNSIQAKNSTEFDATRYGLPFPTVTASGAPCPAGGCPTTLAESFFGSHSTEKDASIEGRYDSPQQYRIRFSFGGFYFYDVATINNTFGIYAPNVPAGYLLSTDFGRGSAAAYQTTDGQVSAAGSEFNYAKTGAEDKSGFVSGEVDLLKGPNYGTVTLGGRASVHVGRSEVFADCGRRKLFHSFVRIYNITNDVGLEASAQLQHLFLGRQWREVRRL